MQKKVCRNIPADLFILIFNSHGFPFMPFKANHKQRNAQQPINAHGNPDTQNSKTPVPSHQNAKIHMEIVPLTMVYRVSPAARNACGKVKDSGQKTAPSTPWSQTSWLAQASASSETL